MTIDELRIAIQKEIEETKEYSEFMRVQIKPMTSTIGRTHFNHLHFFNLGYQFAMEKIAEELASE